jgi:drug/metabolite transporter (DMT)-like permease
MTIAVAYILISVVAGGAGQILLKQGMSRMGEITIVANQVPMILWRIATNPFVVGGLALYAGGTIFWLAALSRVDLSFAYPFASLSYIIMLLASWQLFNENISLLRLAGTIVIGMGVFMISRS